MEKCFSNHVRYLSLSGAKIIFLGVISVAFLFLIGISDSRAAYGTSTLMTPGFQNRMTTNFDSLFLKLELNSTSDPPEILNSITVIVATSSDAAPTSTATSSFEYIGIIKDVNQSGLYDPGDILLATSSVAGFGTSTTINLPQPPNSNATSAIGVFFVTLRTSNLWTDNNWPDDQNATPQAVTITLPANGVVASATVATINGTTTPSIVADTHSQQPATSTLRAFYQDGNYYLQEQAGQTLGEWGTTTIYANDTTTTALAVVALSPDGHPAGPILLDRSYLSSVWLDLVDIFNHPTSTRVQYNLPALPTITSIKAFTDRIIFNTNKNLRGDQATICSNYTVDGSTLNCVGPGYPFIDFFGNRVVIRDLRLTSDSQISFSVSGVSDTSENFPFSYSTTTLLVQKADIPTITSISPRATTTGATVTISGSNFGDSTGTLMFAGGFDPQTGPKPPVAASTTAWSNESITAIVPNGAQSGPVIVITSDGIESDITEASFFDIFTNVYIRLDSLSSDGSTTTVTTSTNMRIFIGSPMGENIYYVGDSNNTSFNTSTYVYTLPNISSMGFTWAYDISGNYLSSMGMPLQSNTSSSTPQVLTLQGTTTKAVSGTITLGDSCTKDGQNKWVAVMALPEGVKEGDPGGPGPGGGISPSFFQTNESCKADYALALTETNATSTYRVEAHLPPFAGENIPLIDPASQIITISANNPTTTVNFSFTSADRSIYGQIVGKNGEPLSPQKYKEIWVFAFEPKADGKGTAGRPNSSGYFRLYVSEGVYKIGVGGPMMPFPIERDITVDSRSLFNPDSTTTALTIRLEPPTTYIEGYVKDGAGNPISDVDIFCWCEGGPGGGHAFTDPQGHYKMYVPPCRKYHVGGYAKNYGQLTEQKDIEVNQNSNPIVNFTLSAADFVTVSGTVTKSGQPLANADVWITKDQFGPGIGGGRSDSTGNYQITLQRGQSNLYLHAAIPGQGEFYNASLGTVSTNTTHNISVTTAIVEIHLAPGDTFEKVFIGAHSSIGHSFTDLRLATTSDYDIYKIEVPYNTQSGTVYTFEGGIPGFGPIPATSTLISTSTILNINLGTIEFYTVSGTVIATGTSATATDAFVWAGGPAGGGGTKVGSDGSFTLKLRAGTYDIGVGKADYTGEVLKDQNISTTTTGLTLHLTKNTQTISGHVKYGNTTIANAKVWADNGSGGWSGTVSQADGSFILSVGPGEWKLGVVAEGYWAEPIRITAPASGIILNVSPVTTFNPERKEQSIIPIQGGIIQTSDTKVELPGGALGSESTKTAIKIQKTMKVPDASGAKIFSNNAKEITAIYSEGNNKGRSISILKKSIDIEMVLTKDELKSAGINSTSSAQRVKIGYFDETAGNWVEIPTVVIFNPSAPTSWNDLVSITLKGTTQHLSTFAPMYSQEGAPDTPTGLTATAGDGQVTLNWTASSGATKYNIYRRSDSQYLYWAQTTNTTYTDTGLTNGTTYYYKVSALNDANQESSATEVVSATPQATVEYVPCPGGMMPSSLTKKKEKKKEVPVKKPITEMTAEELKAEITRLTTLIVQLQARLAELTRIPVITGIPSGFSFQANLKFGDVSNDVKYLQIVLNSDPETRLAETGVGSPGRETNYFGPLTKAAVIKFQEKYASEILAPLGLQKGTGYVGLMTRAKINQFLQK